MKELLLLSFVVPAAMLLVSVFLKYGKHPYPGPSSYRQTKWKVDFSGYNTPGSRKSQARWDYAQQVAPSAFFQNALLALAAAFLCCVVGLLWEQASRYPLWCLTIIFMGRAFRQVEKALKEEFGP